MEIYRALLRTYGPQHWWPASGAFQPRELEVIVGAVLTQNTNWANVEKALGIMEKEGLTTLEKICSAERATLERAIKPSGFFRQKADRLRGLLVEVHKRGGTQPFLETVTRNELLELPGIGPETADSILLYAAGRAEFVADAYTRRIGSRLGLFPNLTYGEVKRFFEERLPVTVYNEFHALLVRHAKERCTKEPGCAGCPLLGRCAYGRGIALNKRAAIQGA